MPSYRQSHPVCGSLLHITESDVRPPDPISPATASVPAPRGAHPFCAVKITVALAVVILSLVGLFLTDPATRSAATPVFALTNTYTALFFPTWRRRCKRRCVLKATVAVALVWGFVVLAVCMPDCSDNSNAVLCIAAALLVLLPATPFLADRNTSRKGRSL